MLTFDFINQTKLITERYSELLEVHERLIKSSQADWLWSKQKKISILEEIKKGREEIKIFNELLKQVKYPMYFTSGNHDSYVDVERVKSLLSEYGVRVLDNELIHTKGIQLIGLDYMNADDEVFDAHASSRKETIKSVLPELKIDPGIPLVIVHHSPVGIKYMNQAGADLVLSGHTHGGQIFPASLIAKMQFKYLKGLYEYKDTLVHVSQGIGTFGPPMRVGTKGEAILVRLIPSKNNIGG